MRELKPEEIKNKPWWANSYSIQDQSGEPIFYAGLGGGAMPIPSGEFDITSYDFSDGDIQSAIVDGCEGHKYLHFIFKEETIELTQSKFDVIAMAKALKLNAEDLR